MNAFVLKLGSKKFSFLALALSIGLAYGNSMNNGFLWDDEFLIDENAYITSFTNIGKIFSSSSTAGFGTSDSFYRPLQMLTYMVAFSISGETISMKDGKRLRHKKPWAFHLLNTLLHLLNAWLLFLLILRVWKNPTLAFMTSLFWSVHPVHTEAITYMSGTADPLSVAFALGCVLSFLKAQEQSVKRRRLALLGSALLLFLGALLSKEAIIITPGLLLIFIVLSPKKRTSIQCYLETLPFWLLAFSYFFARQSYLNFNESLEFYKTSNIYTENWHYRAYTFLATLGEYLKILIWPLDLHMERKFPVFVEPTSLPVIVGSSIVICSFAWLLKTWRQKNSPSAFATLWFFISFVPMCGILIPVNAFLLEHWLYLSSFGLFLIIGGFATTGLQRAPKFALPVVSILVIAMISLTANRNRDWKDPITFYSNILSYSPGTARIHNNLAMAYADEKKWPFAIYYYTKAIGISDTYPQPHYNLSRIYIQKKDYKKARSHLLRSLEIQPDFPFSKRLLKRLDQNTNP